MRDKELDLKGLKVEAVLDNFGEIYSFKLVKDTNHYNISLNDLANYLIDISYFDK